MLTEISVAAVIVFVCVLLHVGGLMLMAEWLFNRRDYFEQSARLRQSVFIVLLFSGILVLLVSETALWGALLLLARLVRHLRNGSLFFAGKLRNDRLRRCSVGAQVRLLGAIEGISGVLLCGISTAFMFAVINGMFQVRYNIRQRLAPHN